MVFMVLVCMKCFVDTDSIASALAELSLVFPEWNAGTWLGEAERKNVE